MLRPGPRLLGAGSLQELPLASVNASSLLLISEKQNAFRAYRQSIHAGLNPQEEARMPVKPTPLKTATATVEESLRGRVLDLVCGPKNGPRNGLGNAGDLQLDC